MLPQSVSEANQEAEFHFDVVGEIEDVRSIVKSGTAKIGILATTLARDIRLEYELPYRLLKYRDYDVEEKLREVVDDHNP